MVSGSRRADPARSVASLARTRARDLRALALADARAESSRRAANARRLAAITRGPAPRRDAQVARALGVARRRAAAGAAVASSAIAGAYRTVIGRASAARALRRDRRAADAAPGRPGRPRLAWVLIGQASLAAAIAFGLVIGTYAGIRTLSGREGVSVAAPSPGSTEASQSEPTTPVASSASDTSEESSPSWTPTPTPTPVTSPSPGLEDDDAGGEGDDYAGVEQAQRYVLIAQGDAGRLQPEVAVAANGSRIVYTTLGEATGGAAVPPTLVHAVDLSTFRAIDMVLPGPRVIDEWAVAPGGKTVAYVSRDTVGVCSTVTGACVEKKTAADDARGVRWSQDSRLFLVVVCGSPSLTTCDVYSGDGATAKLTPLVSGVAASFSHDGTRVAWLDDPEGDGTFGLWVATSSGASPARLAGDWPARSDGYSFRPEGPRWSPDDSMIAVVTGTTSGDRRKDSVHVVAAASGADTVVEGLPETVVGWADWSPASSHLGVWVRDYGPVRSVSRAYVVSPGTSAATLVSGDVLIGSAPSWAGSGTLMSMLALDPTFSGSSTWSVWQQGEPAASGADGECTSRQGAPPRFLPASGEHSTRAVGWLSCPGVYGEGLYLIDLALPGPR